MVRIGVFGPEKSGKTSLIQRYMKGLFLSTEPTIGWDVQVIKKDVIIYDVGGEKRWRCMYKDIIPRCDCLLFCVNPNNPPILDDVSYFASFKKPVLLVKTKIDEGIGESLDESLLSLSGMNNLFGPYTCSAKTGENVDYVFETAKSLFTK